MTKRTFDGTDLSPKVKKLPTSAAPAPAPPDSRDRILDAAERLFADKGFAATSMRHIAQGAGVNVATLYYHCGSKEQLFVSIYARVIERMSAWVAETFEAGDDFRTIVIQLVDRVVDYLAAHPSIPRLLLRSDLGDIPGADEGKHQVYRPLFDIVAQVMAARVKSGEIRRVDPIAFVTAATGLILYSCVNLGRSGATDAVVEPIRLRAAQAAARNFILGALGLPLED
jgi:AcrR family transcriptional regulator